MKQTRPGQFNPAGGPASTSCFSAYRPNPELFFPSPPSGASKIVFQLEPVSDRAPLDLHEPDSLGDLATSNNAIFFIR